MQHDLDPSGLVQTWLYPCLHGRQPPFVAAAGKVLPALVSGLRRGGHGLFLAGDWWSAPRPAQGPGLTTAHPMTDP
jgi:hypothetical protein